MSMSRTLGLRHCNLRQSKVGMGPHHGLRLLDLPSNRLEELFIKFWTPEGMVTWKGAAITIWPLKPLTNEIVSTMGAAITIWRFIDNDQSNRLPKFR